MSHERAEYYAGLIRHQVIVPVSVNIYAETLSRITVHLPSQVKVIDTPEQAERFLSSLNEYRHRFG